MNDLKTNTVRTAKFSSIGKLAKRSSVAGPREEQKEVKKDGSDEEEPSSDEEAKRDEILK